MSRFVRSLLTIAFALTCVGGASAPVWHPALFLDGGGYWRQRIRVVAHNGLSETLEGRPGGLAIGTGDGEANLVGHAAEAIRVVDGQGTEMLFAVYSAQEALVAHGPIPDASTLVLPVQCAAQATAVYY